MIVSNVCKSFFSPKATSLNSRTSIIQVAAKPLNKIITVYVFICTMKKSNSLFALFFWANLLIISLLSGSTSWAQQSKVVPGQQVKKQLTALRVTASPKIDGILDENEWENAPVASEFIQFRPNPGALEKYPTTVKVMYDNEAIYVGVLMQEMSQDSIYRQLSKRDEFGNTDFFGIFLDTYNDENNGFGFFITPAGVQLDARYASGGNEDWSWNAVWESSVRLEKSSWVAEIKIPYSALRFSSKKEQEWGINFIRKRQVVQTDYFWSPIDQNTNGFVNQWGKLVGLKNIEAPLRLSFTPYVSGLAMSYPITGENSKDIGYKEKINFSGGMDVKYGINDAFTLDMTLIPDFSQVQSDNQVLNLSPFEVQFNENRPFFMEGTELFNKGGFFYSRRIGGRPINAYKIYDNAYKGYTVIESPSETKMINGTKFSGRTQSGLGIGVFNAIVGSTYATIEKEGKRIEIETQPLTNYNIAVFDQSLKNNSHFTLVNTNVMRAGSTYDANLTGTVFRLANKSNTYAINGKAALSQKYHTNETNLGYMYRLGVGKVSGSFQYNIAHSVESDTYDPNDMGILFTNNKQTESVNFKYNRLKPFWNLLSLNANLGGEYTRRIKPDTFQDFVINSSLHGRFKNFWNAGLWANLKPVETNDFFEPRVSGWHYVTPRSFKMGSWFGTDYSKKVAIEGGFDFGVMDENNRRNFSYFFAPRYQVNNQFTLNYNYSQNMKLDDIGFVNIKTEDNVIDEGEIKFGKRDVQTVTNTLSGIYSFNNKMSLTTRVRHYWSKAAYNKFYGLTKEGRLGADDYTGNHDINFNAFNVDMVYSWWFAPGSEISITWKNSILDGKNTVLPRYFENLSNTITSPQTNSLSVKLIYYIDYLTLKNRFIKS
jgi:hypothetical protein